MHNKKLFKLILIDITITDTHNRYALFGLVGDGRFLVSHVSASPRGLYCIGVGIMYLCDVVTR